jgi:hypothetical protein
LILKIKIFTIQYQALPHILYATHAQKKIQHEDWDIPVPDSFRQGRTQRAVQHPFDHAREAAFAGMYATSKMITAPISSYKNLTFEEPLLHIKPLNNGLNALLLLIH